MTRQDYLTPTIEIVDVEHADVITTSILLPPYEFGKTNGTQYGGYDVF